MKKPGPVVEDTISDRHEYANLTWIRFGMANLLNVKTMTRYSSIPNIHSRCNEKIPTFLLGCRRMSDA